jgi:hypothetical protein
MYKNSLDEEKPVADPKNNHAIMAMLIMSKKEIIKTSFFIDFKVKQKGYTKNKVNAMKFF